MTIGFIEVSWQPELLVSITTRPDNLSFEAEDAVDEVPDFEVPCLDVCNLFFQFIAVIWDAQEDEQDVLDYLRVVRDGADEAY